MARFATTNWSVVLAAGNAEHPRAREALSALCESYWYPVYALVRSLGAGAEDARDLTQGYFLGLLDGGSLRSVRPQAGRFRSFLFASVRHFLSNQRDRERAVKRGGGRAPLSLDFDEAEGRYRLDPSDPAPGPDRLFERRWALTVIDNAMAELREQSAGADRDRFERLRGYLIEDGDGAPYARVAAELGMSESAVKVGVHRLRQRFGRALREVVGRTVSDPVDIDDEIRALLAALDG